MTLGSRAAVVMAAARGFKRKESAILILTRRVYEEIVITVGKDEIILKVCEIAGGQVKLGFVAPQQVLINRREIQDRKPAPPRLPERSDMRKENR